MKIEENPELKKHIIKMLGKRRSPDEIAGRLAHEGRTPRIGKDTIYRWLYSVWVERYAHLLCTKRRQRKRQRKKTKREMIPDRIPLIFRPFSGIHGEGDLFVSPRRAHTAESIAVVAVPDTKLVAAVKVNDRTPARAAFAYRVLAYETGIDDLTRDNGVENKNHRSV